MAVYKSNMFIGERIVLDGSEFVDNDFTNCVLVYGGGELKMVGNNLTNITWEFTGAAARTVALLASLYQGGGAGRGFVELLMATFGKPKQTPVTQPEDAKR